MRANRMNATRETLGLQSSKGQLPRLAITTYRFPCNTTTTKKGKNVAQSIHVYDARKIRKRIFRSNSSEKGLAIDYVEQKKIYKRSFIFLFAFVSTCPVC